MDNVKTGAFTRLESFSAQAGRNIPRFYTDSVRGQDLDGRPTFREVEFVEIIMPGNNLSKPVHEVTDKHRNLWPKEYEDFKKGLEPSYEGTPLEQWPILNKSMIKELKHMDIFTVEHMAGLADNMCQRIGMGAYELREKARAFTDAQSKIALEEKLYKENDNLRATVAAQQSQIDDLSTRLTTMHSQFMAKINEQPALATNIPGHSYNNTNTGAPVPLEQVTSSLSAFAETKKKPGRPKKDAAA